MSPTANGRELNPEEQFLRNLSADACLIDHDGKVQFSTAGWKQKFNLNGIKNLADQEIYDYFSALTRLFNPPSEAVNQTKHLIKKTYSGKSGRGKVTFLHKGKFGEKFVEVQIRALSSKLSKYILIEHFYEDQNEKDSWSIVEQIHHLKMLALVAKNTDSAIVITDKQGETEWINPGFEKMTGFSPEDMKGKRPGAVLQGPDSDKASIERMSTALKKGLGFNEVILNYRKDGTPFWLDLEVRPIYNCTGNLERFIAIQKDVTNNVNFSQALELENQKRRQILEAASVVEWDYDVFSDVLFLTENWWNILNLPFSSELKNKVLHNEDNAEDGNSLARVLGNFAVNDEPTFEHLICLEDESKETRHLLARGHKTEGNIEFISGILMDVTKQKKLEELLSRIHRLEALGRLSAGIAHEINTPMQYVGSNIEFIRKAVDRILSYNEEVETLISRHAEQEQALHSALQKAKIKHSYDRTINRVPTAIKDSLHGISSISQIITALKDQSHFRKSPKIPTDINSTIEGVLLMSHNEWKYHARIEKNLDPNLPKIDCYPGEMNQVLLNLILNAAHAIADSKKQGKGLIKIGTSLEEQFITIQINDSGIGMSSTVQSKMYDPFFTTKSIGRGTGQGLSIVHSLVVKRHGGKIDVESSPGEGSTFSVRLPLPSGETETFNNSRRENE